MFGFRGTTAICAETSNFPLLIVDFSAFELPDSRVLEAMVTAVLVIPVLQDRGAMRAR
jgi:hypothetical protein